MNEIDELIDEVLVDGLDDWVMLVGIVRAAEERHADDEPAARRSAVELLHELVERGWMCPGDLGDNGFEPWVSEPVDSVHYIVRELDKCGWDVLTNVIAWFANTEEGMRRARATEQRGISTASN